MQKYVNENISLLKTEFLELKNNVMNELSGLNYTKNNTNGSCNNCTNEKFNYLDKVSKEFEKESIFLQEELRNKNAVIQVKVVNIT